MNYKRYKPEGYVTFYYKDKEIHFLFDTKIDMWEEKIERMVD